jgi:hypothetical protein
MVLPPRLTGLCDCGGNVYEEREKIISSKSQTILRPGISAGHRCFDCKTHYDLPPNPEKVDPRLKALFEEGRRIALEGIRKIGLRKK